MNIKNLLLNLIEDTDYKPSTLNQLMKSMDIQKNMQGEFKKIINDLVDDNKIRITSKNKIMPLTQKEKDMIGIIVGNKSGYAFFLSENKDIDKIFIAHKNLNNALNGDRVFIKIIKQKEDEKNAEGKVLKILKRSEKNIVGTFYKSKNFGFVESDDPGDFDDIHIDKKFFNAARNNDKVIVQIIDYPKNNNPEGKIIDVLGNKNQRKIDILSLASSYQIPIDFSEETRKEAEIIETEINKKEIENRKDLRDLYTVTIDGIDSKDFDDAISIIKKDNSYVLFVHIADVSHYVKENTQMDKDAFEKGNSTYLYDIVLPMLPEELSNGICSLNPNVDRLSVTVELEFDKFGKLLNQDYYNSVINSDNRLCYRDVNKLLDENENVFDDKCAQKLLEFNELYKILAKNRADRGSINFETSESDIIIDQDGKVVDVKRSIRGSGNKLIEEFMLKANESVASLFSYMEIPFIYRIHEKPEKDKINQFKQTLNLFGYNIKGDNLYPKDFQKILDKIKGKKEEHLLNTLMLRTMQKAKYSPENKGHFGLSLENYTHFTSPIRRYSDLIVHRLLKVFMDNRIDTIKQRALYKKLNVQSEHLSMTERRSELCERDVEDLEKCKYMKEKIGHEYLGLISSITNFGIFVELENTIEGLFMYKFSDLNYTFNQTSLSVINTDKKRQYKIGDQVKIKVLDVDIEQRNIDFLLID